MADLLNSPPTSGKTASPRSAAEVEALVREHLPLVGYIARETSSRLPRHLDSDDLTGAGALALVQAAQSFDPSLGVPFARFANTRIRGAMIDQMRQRDWATRSLRSRARALAATSEALTVALGRTPVDSELAAASGLTESEIGEIRGGQDRASLLSLDSFTPEGEGLAATLRDPAPQPEDALVAAERVGYLRDAIAELPDRLRKVVSGYYLESRPLTELATELNVTQSRVSQLRAEGLELLREALSRLLEADAKAGAGAVTNPSQGARGRRRDAYVDAVARRSTVKRRVDVGRYLSANSDVDARL
ncbi:sigma-70 family RNA polymerase sigma factor [Kineosporia succinea]|uniref:RNA polymerase sigma factor for flagellar operon FliA n=1 Tax=Kineosporia succinea TaxID=84632 RepID=A0ABT9P2R3_9ACTN|nr:sigma-70 family RNA polymerase sigma factor [Kineosporia succinea]MDP9826515.1 RNA polymerase sigma factor for flagellar operon FliA [Kineosporia succinea]